MDGTDLSGIPVELDGAVRSEVGFQQRPVCFQDGDGSAAVVIGTLWERISGMKTRTCAEGPLPGAGRNGNMLVLVDCVSIIEFSGKSTRPYLS